MCGPKFCSMKITQDARDYAAGLGDNEKTALGLAGASASGLSPHPEETRSAASKNEVEAGTPLMSEKFKSLGEQVYVLADKMKESSKAL